MRISGWSSDVCSSDLAPLGEDEIAAAREHLEWPHEAFLIPDEVAAEWKKAGERSAGAHEAWQDRLASHSKNSEFERRMAGDLPADRSEEHTSELQSLMRISYAVFCLKKKNNTRHV